MGQVQVFIAVAAGVVLFLFGIEHFSSEVQAVTGARFRRFLARGTRTRLSAFALGAAVTAVIQSSTATSVIAVGLVDAGAMSFRQSLGVIFGANVGTTVTAQLVALKLTDFAPALILVGFVIGLLPFRWRVLGRSVFYFGLVFFSLQLVSAAVQPLKDDPSVLALLAGVRGSALGVAVGAIFTVVVQSSSVTTGVAIVLLGQRVIDFDQALPLIIGANVGTTVTSLIAAASLDTSARRTALSHTLYNVGGALIFLPFLTPFGLGLRRLGLEPTVTLALAHMVFNFVTATVFLAAMTPFSRLVARLLPDDEDDEPVAPLPAQAFSEGRAPAQVAVLSWAASVVSAQVRAYVAAVLALETRDRKIDNRARRFASLIDFALEEASGQVWSLNDGEPDADRAEAVLKLVVTIDHARQLQDSLADLRRIGERLDLRNARFSIDAIIEVQSVYPTCAKLLEALRDLIAAPDDAEARAALEAVEGEAEEALQRAYRRFLELGRRMQERGELADFLSIHQRIRTKAHAFARYLSLGAAAPPRVVDPARGAPPAS